MVVLVLLKVVMMAVFIVDCDVTGSVWCGMRVDVG